MITHIKAMYSRIIIFPVLSSFLLSSLLPSSLYAQNALNLPAVSQRLGLTNTYYPLTLKGMRIHKENPLRFDFIVDSGNSGLSGDALTQETTRLVKYFLASLATPEKDLWVNLSPYEKERIVPENFGITDMGRDLLAQDYVLKQLTASLIYPEDELGKKFWKKVYDEAYKRFGTTDIPLNTFNKVWIVPEKAVVYQQGDKAFVADHHLKVMLEQDYLALEKNRVIASEAKQSSKSEIASSPSAPRNDTSALGSQIVKEIVLPLLEKEVNEGEHFVLLRQIYDALILANWYKQALKDSLLGRAYADQNKVNGIDIEDKQAKEKIWQQYVQAFKKGVYNFVKEEEDPSTHEMIPRKYFSGGFTGAMGIAETRKLGELTARENNNVAGSIGTPAMISFDFQPVGSSAMPAEKQNRHKKLVVYLDKFPEMSSGHWDYSDAKGNNIKVRLVKPTDTAIQYRYLEIKIEGQSGRPSQVCYVQLDEKEAENLYNNFSRMIEPQELHLVRMLSLVPSSLESTVRNRIVSMRSELKKEAAIAAVKEAKGKEGASGSSAMPGVAKPDLPGSMVRPAMRQRFGAMNPSPERPTATDGSPLAAASSIKMLRDVEQRALAVGITLERAQHLDALLVEYHNLDNPTKQADLVEALKKFTFSEDKAYLLSKLDLPVPIREAMQGSHPSLTIPQTVEDRAKAAGITPARAQELEAVLQGYIDEGDSKTKAALITAFQILVKPEDREYLLLKSNLPAPIRETIQSPYDAMIKRAIAARIPLARAQNLEDMLAYMEENVDNPNVIAGIVPIVYRLPQAERNYLVSIPALPDSILDAIHRAPPAVAGTTDVRWEPPTVEGRARVVGISYERARKLESLAEYWNKIPGVSVEDKYIQGLTDPKDFKYLSSTFLFPNVRKAVEERFAQVSSAAMNPAKRRVPGSERTLVVNLQMVSQIDNVRKNAQKAGISMEQALVLEHLLIRPVTTFATSLILNGTTASAWKYLLLRKDLPRGIRKALQERLNKLKAANAPLHAMTMGQNVPGIDVSALTVINRVPLTNMDPNYHGVWSTLENKPAFDLIVEVMRDIHGAYYLCLVESSDQFGLQPIFTIYLDGDHNGSGDIVLEYVNSIHWMDVFKQMEDRNIFYKTGKAKFITATEQQVKAIIEKVHPSWASPKEWDQGAVKIALGQIPQQTVSARLNFILESDNIPGEVRAAAQAKLRDVGGIDLGNGKKLQIINFDPSGAPVFDPHQFQEFIKDFTGLIPVPVGLPQPINLPLMTGLVKEQPIDHREEELSKNI